MYVCMYLYVPHGSLIVPNVIIESGLQVSSRITIVCSTADAVKSITISFRVWLHKLPIDGAASARSAHAHSSAS